MLQSQSLERYLCMKIALLFTLLLCTDAATANQDALDGAVIAALGAAHGRTKNTFQASSFAELAAAQAAVPLATIYAKKKDMPTNGPLTIDGDFYGILLYANTVEMYPWSTKPHEALSAALCAMDNAIQAALKAGKQHYPDERTSIDSILAATRTVLDNFLTQTDTKPITNQTNDDPCLTKKLGVTYAFARLMKDARAFQMSDIPNFSVSYRYLFQKAFTQMRSDNWVLDEQELQQIDLARKKTEETLVAAQKETSEALAMMDIAHNYITADEHTTLAKKNITQMVAGIALLARTPVTYPGYKEVAKYADSQVRSAKFAAIYASAALVQQLSTDTNDLREILNLRNSPDLFRNTPQITQKLSSPLVRNALNTAVYAVRAAMNASLHHSIDNEIAQAAAEAAFTTALTTHELSKINDAVSRLFLPLLCSRLRLLLMRLITLSLLLLQQLVLRLSRLHVQVPMKLSKPLKPPQSHLSVALQPLSWTSLMRLKLFIRPALIL